MLCVTAHCNKTISDIARKGVLRQRLFGMRATLPVLLCRCIHRKNATKSRIATRSKAMLPEFLASSELYVRMLRHVSIRHETVEASRILTQTNKKSR